MSTITKFNISRENFPEYFYHVENAGISQDPHEFTHTLDITDTVMEYKFSRKKMGDETADVIFYNIKLNIDLIRNHNLLTDQSYFTVKRNKIIPDLSVIEETNTLLKPENSVQTELFNSLSLLSIFDKTYSVRPTNLITPWLESDKPYMFPLRIFVPHAAASFDECTFHVLATNDTTKVINNEDNIVPLITSDIWNIVTDTTKHTVINSNTSYKSLFAPITSSTTVTSPSVGDAIPVTVTCADTSVSKLYLDQVVGVLDKLQVDLTNGVGTFTILTNTLSAGETVKVKIGYKKYSSVNIFTKTLA
jgi:hypothetical protein